MFEKKYKIYCVRKEYNTMHLVKIISTNSLNDTIKIEGKMLNIRINEPFFTTEKQKVYVLDFDLGSNANIREIQPNLNANEFDLLVGKEFIKQLIASSVQNKKDLIFNMILGAIIGACISAIIMFIYMNNQIAEIYKSVNVTPIIP